MSKIIFERLTLIGIGLIGSSIARRVRQDGSVREIVVCAKTKKTLERAKKLKLGDEYILDAKKAVKNADCVIVCTPVGACESIAKKIRATLAKDAIVSDVGSVKGSVIEQMQPHLPKKIHFIPAHPIAGTEYSGPDAGFSTLFENRWCILTPPDKTDKNAIKKISKFWKSMGSQVDIMEAQHHDRVLAVTSHIPHLIAYNIVGTASDLEEITDSEIMKFAAGGFRDFTRIAASDPTMWRDVFIHNKKAVLEILGRFAEDIFRLQRAIRWEDGKMLFNHFTRTRSIRKKIIKAGQEVDTANFGRDNVKKNK